LKGDYASLVQEIEVLTTNRQHCEATLKGLTEETAQKRELNELLETQTKVLVEDREMRCNKLDKSIAELDGALSARRGELLVATEQFETVQNQHRQLAAEIDHLSRVKVAMETSVNELTDRLANKSTDFKRKTLQVHELANRLEALTETVKSRREIEGSMGGLDVQQRGRSDGARLHGPHWNNDQVQKIFDRIDDIDELTEEGLE